MNTKNVPEKEVGVILDFLEEITPYDQIPNADAIFVFGHIAHIVAQDAARLFLAGKSSRVIVTGGVGTAGRDPSGFPSEAEYFASVMEKGGVPKESIILETEATQTLENVVLGMKAAHNAGFYPKSLILVALSPLLRRARATFKKQFPDITTYGSASPIGRDINNDERLIERMLGEIDRLKEYAEKGDIVAIEIPEKVLGAYNVISSTLKK